MLPIAAFAIPGAIQGTLGLGQLIGGSLMKPKRPEYDIPAAAKEELAMSRMALNSRMPGIGYSENRLAQNSANAAYGMNRAATNPNQILAGLAGIQMQANIASRGLMEAEASDFIRRESNLRRSLGVMANYQNRKWEMNKLQPYLDKARTKAALIGSGLQNISGGVGQALGGVLSAQMMQNSMTEAAQGDTSTAQNPFANLANLAKMGNDYMRRPIQPLGQPLMQLIQSIPPMFLQQRPYNLNVPFPNLKVNAGDGMGYYPY